MAASVMLSPARWSLPEVGDTVRFLATVRDSNERLIDGARVVWSSSDSGVVRVDSHGLVTAAGRGRAKVFAKSGAVAQSVPVVTAMFNIELLFRDSVPPEHREHQARFVDAANFFMVALAETEVPPIPDVTRIPLGIGSSWCGGTTEARTVHGLLVVVTVEEGRYFAAGGPCIRRDGGLPLVGRMTFSPSAFERDPDADFERLVRHEMAHVLGIGTGRGWNPLSGSPHDTHFPGSLAVAAFDAAGGSGYADGKVPVANDNVHWRASVMGCEVMSAGCGPQGIVSPTSAITLQALADMGFTVDPSMADPYTLPEADADAAAYAFEDDAVLPDRDR
ncbi:Ig-like domain-containing protein [Candidatus Palauibacter sp.]|uniref:Ig-like domain-containing protein n=1 Tax=Candidatus Palauibacter sp. TaxID=3101350 RepID=UPI003CC5E7E4